MKVHVHDESFSGEELLLSPEFSEISEGDIVEVVTAFTRIVLVARFSEVSTDAKAKRLKISLLKRVADACGVAAWTDVEVIKVDDAQRVAADFVEFSFKDQFVSRANIWRFKGDVIGSPMYVGKTFELGGGTRCVAMEVRDSNGRSMDSAMLVERTRFVFRSRSTRVFWLLQMSFEMWEPTLGDDGALHIERLVDGFAAPLLRRWREADVNHSLSVCLFSRLGVEGGESHGSSDEAPRRTDDDDDDACESPPVKPYEDVFRVVLENEASDRIDEVALVSALKKELVAFSRSLRQFVASKRASPKFTVLRASQGNALEAINLALNVLDKHYMDRDLQRTGNSIVLVTAGAGVIVVDARLAQITKQRMMDNGIGMDMLSLGVPPLHTAPIFMHKEPRRTCDVPRRSFAAKNAFSYEVPHWINLSFLDADRAGDPRAWIAAAAPRRAAEGWRLPTLEFGAKRRPRAVHEFGVEDEDLQSEHARPRPKLVPEALAHLVQSAWDTPTDQQAQPRPFLGDAGSEQDGHLRFALRGRNLPDSPSPSDRAFSSEAYSSMSSKHWRPSIHIGSLTGSDVDDAATRWYEVGASLGSSFEQHGLLGVSPRACLKRDAPREKEKRESDAENGAISENDLDGADDALPFVYDRSQRAAEEEREGDDYPLSQGIVEEALPRAARRSKHFHNRQAAKQLATRLPLAQLLESFDAYDEGIYHAAEPRGSPAPVVQRHFSQDDGSGRSKDPRRRSPVRPLARRPMKSKSPTPVATSLPTWHEFESEFEKSEKSERAAPDPRRSPGESSRDFAPPPPLIGNVRPTAPGATDGPHSSLHSTLHAPAHSTLHASLHTSTHATDAAAADAPLSPGGALFSDGDGGDGAHKRFVNPFKREDETDLLRQRSHNRRRWSHVFPLGQEEFRSAYASVAGPNWKSLCTPAILPLDTDCLPADFGTHVYAESNHSILLSESDRRANDRVINEMVAQRIGGDYQIVVLPNENEGDFADAHDAQDSTLQDATWSPRGGTGDFSAPAHKAPAVPPRIPEGAVSAAAPAPPANFDEPGDFGDRALRKKTSFDARDGSGKLKRANKNLSSSTLHREYSLGQPFFANMQKSQPGAQPLRGAGEPSSPHRSQGVVSYTLSMGHRIQILQYDPAGARVDVRSYRSRYGVNTDRSNRYVYHYSLWLRESEAEPQRGVYAAKKQAFLKYPSPETNWNALDQVISGFLSPADSLGAVKFRRVLFALVPPVSRAFAPAKSPKTLKTPASPFISSAGTYLERFAKFEAFLNSKAAAQPETGAKNSAPKFAAKLNAVRRANSADVGCVHADDLRKQHLQIALEKDTRWRDEWLALECDAVVETERCYRFAVHWLLCSSCIVADFLALLCRKAKQLDLVLVQVPEYSMDIDIHPFIAHTEIDAAEAHAVDVLEQALGRFDFVADSATSIRRPAAKARTRTLKKLQAPKPTERQYVHSSGCAFVRIRGKQFLWVRNRLRTPFTTMAERSRQHDSAHEYDGLLRGFRFQADRLRLLCLAFGQRCPDPTLVGDVVDHIGMFVDCGEAAPAAAYAPKPSPAAPAQTTPAPSPSPSSSALQSPSSPEDDLAALLLCEAVRTPPQATRL
ncbi:hypothetical protein M885DRAFT_511366 [Pelagophyceae sp. CCMP2097]|nr:hypothetical protein M885DRAFT_511366 [Pelagophyceae sp. CCMP2097]